MSAPALAYKGVAVADGADSQVIAVDEAEGVVTAVVSVTGVIDEVDDIIEPGAYAETLKARKPKVCWHHAWEKPVGRVLHIEELMPGDRRLPTKTRDGKPWPAEAGALIATMQMNLKSERGREAFEAVRFYSESGECEWSIGYQVPPGKSTRDKKGVRRIKGLDLYELSFVLFGAHTMTGTLSLKAAVQVMTRAKAAGAVTVTAEEIQETLRLLEGDAVAGSEAGSFEQEVLHFEEKRDLTAEQRRRKPTLPGSDDAWPIGDRTDLQAAINSFGRAKPEDRDKVKRWIIRRARELGAISMLPEKWGVKKSLPELPSDPEAKVDTRPGDRGGNAADLIEWYVHGEGAAKIRWGTKGDFDRCVRIAGKHMTPEQAKGFCANRHHDATGEWPGRKRGDKDGKAAPASDLTDAAPPPVMANEDEPEQSGVMVAVFPDEATAEQIAVRGGDKPSELHVTLAYLGNVADDIGDGMTLGDAIGRIVAAAQIAAATHEPLSGSVGGIGRFPDSGDGVPVWAPVDVVGLTALRESVVTALTDGGLPVKTDHGFTPHMTLGFNLDMSLIPPLEEVPVTFDRLVVAVGDARTEVPLGQDPDVPASGAPVAGAPLNPPLDGVKAAAYDPSIEVEPKVAPAAGKGFPRLEGTYEERQTILEQALREALLAEWAEDPDERSKHDVMIDGTWPDRVICTVHDWSGPGGEHQSYEVPYTFTADGSIALGEPQKVRLTVTAVDADGEEMPDVPIGDMLPLPEMIEAVTAGLKNITGSAAGPDLEVKAGRVLSAANAQRLRSAVEHLISVLAAAGIEVGDSTDRPRTRPMVDTETTAPSARDGIKSNPAETTETTEVSAADIETLLADIETVTQET